MRTGNRTVNLRFARTIMPGGTLLIWLSFVNLAAWVTAGQPAKPAGDNTSKSARELVVDPAHEPVPALRYHLLPRSPHQIRGNAAPILTRILHQQSDEWKTRLYDDVGELYTLPIDELPLDKARETLEYLAGTTKQLHAAAMRSDCNWEYVTEDQDPLQILLSDAQSMRSYVRLLVLKSRYEMRIGNLPSALAAIEDSTALARHTAAAPFLVNQLIGSAILEAGVFEQLDTFVSQPNAPNLYWALATLPRPLSSLVEGAETERRILVMKFPELADMNQPRAEQQWQELAVALRKWSAEVRKQQNDLRVSVEEIVRSTKAATPEQLAAAREYLRDAVHLPADQITPMSNAEVEVRYTIALWAEVSDDWIKWFFIPYPQSLPLFVNRSEALLLELRRRELFPLLSVLSPLGGNLLAAQARPELKRARLQVVEAVRMHAAATGKLPASLEEITVVPVPPDPASGKPFRYELDGNAAVIDLPEENGISREHVNLPVRIRLRGK